MTTIPKKVNPLKLAKAEASPRPVFITKGNSLAATGQDLRFWKQHFPHLVRHVARKDVLLADELEQAVSRAGAPIHNAGSDIVNSDGDPAEAVRELLRRAGGR